MRRIDLYVDDPTFIKLKGLPGTISEHVRSAIKQYLDRLYQVNISASQSRREDE
jgi:hypothetical protein